MDNDKTAPLVRLSPSVEAVAHTIATGLETSIRAAAEHNNVSPQTIYNHLARDGNIREAFEQRITEHRDRRADKAGDLLRKSEKLAARAIARAEQDNAPPLENMQIAALGTKVAAEIRAPLGDTSHAQPATESIDALANHIRRGIIHSIACTLADPRRAEGIMRRLMATEHRRIMNGAT